MTESKVPTTKLIGYWMSEKKSQKLNWFEFGKVCRSHGYELVKLDLQRPIADQGPFTAIIHKLNDIIAKALQNDHKAKAMLDNLEQYIALHPEVVVIDPLDNVRKLIDRYLSYRIVLESDLHEIDVFTPTFVELTSSDIGTNIKILEQAHVKFPFICKPSVANGTDCHKMAIVFNARGLKQCQMPCVAHTIVNHNAILYKIFIVGGEYHVVQRPSIKNFYPSPDAETIHFDSHDVSKSDSTSALSVLDEEDEAGANAVSVDPSKLAYIVKRLRKKLGMNLLGVDVVVDRSSGRHAIIDINPYPGYEGFPDFFNSLIRCIEAEEKEHLIKQSSDESPVCPEHDDSGFETADSSDEKKRNSSSSLFLLG